RTYSASFDKLLMRSSRSVPGSVEGAHRITVTGRLIPQRPPVVPGARSTIRADVARAADARDARSGVRRGARSRACSGDRGPAGGAARGARASGAARRHPAGRPAAGVLDGRGRLLLLASGGTGGAFRSASQDGGRAGAGGGRRHRGAGPARRPPPV